LEVLKGIVERITYRSDETGYTVAKFRPEGKLEAITIVGEIASISPGETAVVEGYWTVHSQYGRQFKVTSYRMSYPSTVEGIRKYLGSGLIRGIGPVLAERITRRFGEGTLRVIEETPERLAEVEGLGPRRVEMIRRAWDEQKQIREVMLFLQSHDVNTTHAFRIYKEYGDRAIEVLTREPYRLARDIWGIGFVTADRIASKLGVPKDSPGRIKAAIVYFLENMADEGHVYFPMDETLEGVSEMLTVGVDLVTSSLGELEREGGVVVDQDMVYLPSLYRCEIGIAERLADLIASPGRAFPEAAIELEIEQLEKRQLMTFAGKQRAATRAALRSNVFILTGGPGTGKPATTKGIIELLEKSGLTVALCAPTGRAAKRMSELVGREARTIHRLLELSPQEGGRFRRNGDNPIDADAIIVDEVSMVDVPLMYNLLKAIRDGSKLIMVGDSDQLPSVGPGNVLHDLIASGVVPLVHLDEIFRQAKDSAIITNSHRINRGIFPDIRNRESGDFFFIEEEDPGKASEIIRDLCAERLPRYYGYHPIEDIQVICPMYKGDVGAIRLNRMLQETLNPHGRSHRRGEVELRVGDKVMQLRNNYEKMVFNGDVGRITGIDSEYQTVEVMFDEPVRYDFGELDEIVPAYAISVHKSQGSEYKAVVIPITTQHYVMLQRNLLYTAITRAKELVVLVGTRKALAIAVKNDRTSGRYTALPERLRSELARRRGRGAA